MTASREGTTAPPMPGNENRAETDENNNNWLCAACESLGLSLQRFVVGSTAPVADTSSDPASGLNSRRPINVRLNSGNNCRPFANYSGVRDRRSSCRFCDLTTRAVERYSGDRVDGAAALSLRWEFDSWGRDQDRALSRTRRIRLAWREKDGREVAVYLLFVGSVTLVGAKAAAQPLSPDAGTESIPDKIGEDLDAATERVNLMKSWVETCVTKHGPRCQDRHGERSEFTRLVQGTYFGVIDVLDMQLKELPMIDQEPSQFVALSYVWGKNAQALYVTKRSNVMLHIQPNGLQKTWDRLPRTIQDAILLVRQLGQRYLWIDSLCIVQDSTSSWERNAESMHLVYGSARFTICATDGDANTGLLAAGDHTREAEPCFPSMMVEVLPGVRLLASRPAEAVIQESTWSQRSWTLQERLLSRRCIIFADRQIYFQCRSSVASQNTSSINGIARTWPLDWANSPLGTMRELHRKAYWVYMKCVTLYTARQLTKSRDVLAAFSGVSWLLQKHMNAALFYGLPLSHFDLALLWAPSEKLEKRRNKRRADNIASYTMTDMDNCVFGQEEEEGSGYAEFPSWSWTGWQGGKVEYPPDMLDGVLSNVQDWLKHHTWIQWYVRDQKGVLRPLWEKSVLYRDGSEEPRWRGYAGKSPTTLSPRNNGGILPQKRKKHSQGSGFVDLTGENEDLNMPNHKPPEISPALQQFTTASPLQSFGNLPFQQYTWLQPTGMAMPMPLMSGALLPKPNDAEGEVPQEEQDAPGSSALPDSLTASNNPFQGVAPPKPAYSFGLDESVPVSPQIDTNNTGMSDTQLPEIHDDQSSGKSHALVRHNDGQDEDAYGRPLRDALAGRNTSTFTSILPDNPFGIIQGPFPEDGIDHTRAMPILQFWTWRTELFVTGRMGGDSPPDTAPRAPATPSRALVQCDISDKYGDWCGAIALPSAGIAALSKSAAAATPFHFVALSDAKAFTRDECPVWNYYNSKEREESEWDLYFVMLLQRNKVTALWERVAIGKVFQAAFRDAKWSEVKLG